MRKPKLTLDVESKISKFHKEKRYALLKYCLRVLYPEGDYDALKVKSGFEWVDNYSIRVLTFRYDGKLLFREFIDGTNLAFVNRKYEIYV